jgi:hypothetical protein
MNKLNLQRNQTNFFSLSFIYDFNVNGGAIATYNAGIQIPQYAAFQLYSFIVGDTVLVSSGGPGATTISIGTSLSPALIYTSTDVSFNAPFLYVNTGTFGYSVMDNTENILLTISGAALTAGNFRTYITYLRY